MRWSWACGVVLVAVGPGFAAAQRAKRPPGANHIGRAFEFKPVAEGIYQAVGTGTLGVGSNAAIVINDSDVLLVDSQVSPAAAWVLLDELKALTPKPVRYVVTTHFHYDHAHGNQIYGPGVEIIGHEFTRQMMLAGESRKGLAYEGYVRAIAARPDSFRFQQQVIANRAVFPTPPNLTLSDRLTLFRGGREIQILYFGKGHTGGDVVVYLPKEKVLATGDLLQARLPFMGDGYPDQWVATLERLKSLDVTAVIPGHGAWFSDRTVIDHLQAFLRDFQTQAMAAHRDGLTIPAAARRMDFRVHAAHYPQLADTADTYDRLEGGLKRVYDQLAGKVP